MTSRTKNPPTPTTERIVLLDTHAILHRAYHALPDFTAPDGSPSGALYGLALMLFKIIEELKPDHLIAAYDLPGPTHRHEAFGDYKATRVKADDALVAQLISSRELLDAWGVPRLEAPGFEADDILGTLVELLGKQGNLEIVIASGDMDTLQLVGSRVKVYTLRKGVKDTVLYDEAAVIERYGFPPALVPDYKGLRGDPSDNIPGIAGIGEKTATELIQNFGSLDELYVTLQKHPERFTEAGIKPRIVGLLGDGEDEARFSRELAVIRRDAPISVPDLSVPWRSRAQESAMLAYAKKLGFRTLSARISELFPKDGGQQTLLETQEHEAADPTLLHEASLALWLLESEHTNPSLEDILAYSEEPDLKRAHHALMRELHEKGLDRVLTDIELPLTPVVQGMEERGILLDTKYLGVLSERYHKDLAERTKEVYALAGTEFNLNSPKQLGDVLFEKLGLGGVKGKRTATGQRTTRESELSKLKDAHPIVPLILETRELQKLLSTYIDTLPKLVDHESRLHAHFRQAGTTTGRMSSESPNLQNLPIKSTRGAAIRRAVVAPEGFVLVAADYSQIELRLAAIIADDHKLQHIFKEGGDVHTAVAAEVFSVPPELVDKEMRRRAKAINFGILYGMGAHALAEATGTPRKEAETYLAEYFKRFSGIARYVETIKGEVRARGYTETLLGRRRYFPGIRSPLPYVVAQAERMALNAPIQGTSADLIKLSMVRIARALEAHGRTKDAFLVLQVHDELVYEVREGKRDEVAALIAREMEAALPSALSRGVPIRVDVESGQNWGEMEDVAL